jgi:hypothetical protein
MRAPLAFAALPRQSIHGIAGWLLAAASIQGVVLPGGEDREDGDARMRARLAELAQSYLETDVYCGTAEARALRAQLESLGADAQPLQLWRVLRPLAFHELRLGEPERAIAHLERALHDVLPRMKARVPPAQVRQTRFDLAVAWMRLGEQRNCVARHTSQSCILPIGPEGVHADREGSERAFALLEQLVLENADDAPSRWLLNVVAMTLGRWPDGVPESMRLPADAFESQGTFVRLGDVAAEHGLDEPTLAGAAVADDFDGDGRIDLVTTQMHPAGQMKFFRRTQTSFEERTAEAGLIGITGGLNANQADYDGDGDLDLFVMRGAWLRAAGRYPNSLLQNDGSARFRDVTYDAGLADPAFPTQASAWCDYDLDGDLDLYIGNETDPSIHAPAQLFRNQGDGTFVDVAAKAGVENLHFAKSVAWGDVDEDGRPDLFVSNQNGPNRLYRNLGNDSFVDVALRAGVTEPIASFPAWLFDADDDGHLDLFVGAYLPALEPVARGLLGLPFKVETDALYLGDGKGGFRDVSRAWGFVRPTLPMGANFGDLDQDGWLDVYLGTGYPAYEGLVPNVLWRNDAGKRFLDVTTAAGVGHLQKGHGVAFADFDDDGDTDLFAQLGGAFPGDGFADALFENPGGGAHWIDVRLVGADKNTFGVGARLIVRAVEPDGSLRARHRVVGSGGSFGSNPLRQRIGLGAAPRVHSLEVRWPRGHVQVFEDLPADVLVQVHEQRDEPSIVALGGR